MKKYIVLILIFIISIVVIIGFDLIDRTMILAKGMSQYDMNDYQITVEEREDITVDVNLTTNVNEEIQIFKDSENEVVIKDIEYRGESYRFSIASKGTGKYEYGNILSFEKFTGTDIEINGDYYRVDIVGIDGIVNNVQMYYLDLMPVEEIDTERISKIENVKFQIENVELVKYARK